MNLFPDLTFFCELPEHDLSQLFMDPGLIIKLRKLNANISMGIQDLTDTRSGIVKRLTGAGIPVSAWILLPKEEGYWTSLDTIGATARAYKRFKDWTEKYHLKWAAIGIDLEPSYERIGLLGPAWKQHLPDLFSRFFQVAHYRKALADLQDLVNIIKLDGYPVETYNFPFVIDEQKAASQIISRLLGTPPLDADREVLMLYSSFFDKGGDAILSSYAKQAQGIGLGSTGGGVELEGGDPLRSMTWYDLQRDLFISSQYSGHLYIFSLEGCVKQGFLDRLLTMDWNQPLPQIKSGEIQKIDFIRKTGQGMLWILSHPLTVFIAVLLLSKLGGKKNKD